MSALPPKNPTAPPFSDAFGYRVLGFDKKSHDRLEMLRLRPQLASSAPFDHAIRERQRRLSDFRHPAFARVRQVDRPGGQTSALALVSNHFAGTRLSEVLRIIDAHGVRLDVVTALCMLRQVASAIARLHECGEDISLGALNPERLVVAASGRVIVTEYVLGAGLEALALTRQQVWQDYRVALPLAAAPARLDHAADIFQLGYVGLTLVSGRSLYDRHYPVPFADLLQAAQEVHLDGPPQALHPALHAWLGRALWLDTVPFSSATEAQTSLDEAIATAGLVATPDVVVDLLERCFAVAPDARPRESASDAQATAPPPSEPRGHAPAAWSAPAAPGGWGVEEPRPADLEALQTRSLPADGLAATLASSPVASLLVDAQAAARGDAGPEAPTLAPAPPAGLRAIADVPADEPVKVDVAPELPPAKPWNQGEAELRPERPRGQARAELNRAASMEAPAAPTVRRPYFIALGMAVVMVGLFEVALRYANPFGSAPATAITASELPSGSGTLSIDATPKAKVFIDDAARGETPLRLDLPAGPHRIRLEGDGGASRTFQVSVIAGKEISQLVELSRTALTGTVDVKTDPPGARVLIDGQSVGVSPVSVPDVKPGAHAVLVEGPNGSVRQVVQVAAGATASIVVPLNAPAANVPAGGWISIEAPEELQVYEGGRLLGTSRADRIMVAAGTHDFELRNDALGFTTTRSVQVQGGKVAKVAVQLPNGTLSLNAVPWAEVSVDGQRIGETPVGNVSVRAGTHEIVFRHPQHGEIRQTVLVRAGEGGRVTVNMAK